MWIKKALSVGTMYAIKIFATPRVGVACRLIGSASIVTIKSPPQRQNDQGIQRSNHAYYGTKRVHMSPK
jgi:hypothetical protein